MLVKPTSLAVNRTVRRSARISSQTGGSIGCVASKLIDTIGNLIVGNVQGTIRRSQRSSSGCAFRIRNSAQMLEVTGTNRADTLQNRPGRWFTHFSPFAKACRREACLGL